MNKKHILYYVAVVAAFVSTQAPFWIARQATAMAQTTVTKKGHGTRTRTTRATTHKRAHPHAAASAEGVVAHELRVHKPYKAISSSVCTFDPERNMLTCEHGEGLTLELPVTLQKYTGNQLDFVARLPKSKNALCGLRVHKRGEKPDKHEMAQCGLVIDETRLSEASIAMGEKLKSLKPKHTRTTVAHAPTPSVEATNLK